MSHKTCSSFCWKIDLRFLSFHDIEMEQEVENLSCGIQGPVFMFTTDAMNVDYLATKTGYHSDSKVHGANMGPTGPRWAPCRPHELCYLGSGHNIDIVLPNNPTSLQEDIHFKCQEKVIRLVLFRQRLLLMLYELSIFLYCKFSTSHVFTTFSTWYEVPLQVLVEYIIPPPALILAIGDHMLLTSWPSNPVLLLDRSLNNGGL